GGLLATESGRRFLLPTRSSLLSCRKTSMSLKSILKGPPMTKWYRSKNGRGYFKFAFTPMADHIVVYCLAHPTLGGRDRDPHKTHLFSSGQLCFIPGQEPRTEERAEDLAQQWAEYFLEYVRTGIPQS